MKIHLSLMPLLIAVALETGAIEAGADGSDLAPLPRTGVEAPDAAIDTKGGRVHQGNATEPLQGSYQFLLEVGGITPAEPQQERKRSTGSPRPHDPRATGKAVGSAD